MRRRLDRKNIELRKDEAGYALMWVLVVIILAGIILVPLFLLMTAGLTSSHNHEERMLRFYAADAGIEDGIYRVIHDEDPTTPNDPLHMNDNTVNVTIQGPVEDNTYRITSTATDNDDGKSTTIESYVLLEVADFGGLFDNAITSNGNVTIKPGNTVNGDVQYAGNLYYDPKKSTITGEKINQAVEYWPTAELLSGYYLSPEVVSKPCYLDAIDLKDYADPITIGPLYRNGDLIIKSTASEPKTVTLGGTVYVTGDLTIGLGGNGFTIDLSGQTIYVEGGITVKPNCTMIGSGCIIAVGLIDFQPTLVSGLSDFVFVMSLTSTVTLHPNGDFCGSLVGNATVDLLPGGTLNWRSVAEGELNFPTKVKTGVDVITYTVD
jgi:hypothetical protein